MNNMFYTLRKKSFRHIEHQITNCCDLNLCFKTKNELIFKNNEMLVSCKKQYISILVYEEGNKEKVQEIINLVS